LNVLVADLVIAVSGPKKRKNMDDSTKDQAQGKFHELKGKLKETAGQLTNDPNLTDDGQAEQIAGTVQKKIGQVEKVFEK
jgi:uncharacterized protein YjbJ (UPF0337 family)